MIEKYLSIDQFKSLYAASIQTDTPVGSFGYSQEEACLDMLYENLYDDINEILAEMNLPQEYYDGLSRIGGCCRYHREGNALVHTIMVGAHMWSMHYDRDLTKLALLHDIGKIYTGRINPNSNDWEYPDHSTCGGLKGILCKFLSEDDSRFKEFQWYITNHIKPMFFKNMEDAQNKIAVLKKNMPKQCNIQTLLDLVICDLEGSIAEVEEQENENALKDLLRELAEKDFRERHNI